MAGQMYPPGHGAGVGYHTQPGDERPSPGNWRARLSRPRPQYLRRSRSRCLQQLNTAAR